MKRRRDKCVSVLLQKRLAREHEEKKTMLSGWKQRKEEEDYQKELSRELKASEEEQKRERRKQRCLLDRERVKAAMEQRRSLEECQQKIQTEEEALERARVHSKAMERRDSIATRNEQLLARKTQLLQRNNAARQTPRLPPNRSNVAFRDVASRLNEPTGSYQRKVECQKEESEMLRSNTSAHSARVPLSYGGRSSNHERRCVATPKWRSSIPA
eukprot:GHVS01090413.1.p1 GENE.GHVS01090413.1~~GHVS01090413.1.p1  ORF type:complete len:214 (+),score=40.14 GHVS01090413.1:771-1412(+)